MSETAKQLFDSLRAGTLRAVSEIGAEVANQIGRGASETASLMHQGQAFVLYGHSSPNPTPDQHQNQSQQQQQTRGIER